MKEPLRPADLLLPACATPPALLLLGIAFVAAPRFAGMFADFGSTLPRLTELALQPWTGALLAGGVLAAAWGPLCAGGTARVRRLAPALALVLGLVATGALVIALYLPIFSLAGAVK